MVAIKSIAAIFAAISLVSGAVIRRDVPAILADYQTLSSNIAAFNTAVSGFKGDIGTGLAVSNAATALDNSVKKTTTDINAVPVFSGADSSNIAGQSNTLASAVVSSLNGLNAKAPAFKSAGFASLVLSQLNTLHTDNAAFAQALEAKVQPTDLSSIQLGALTLENAFNQTTATFSS